jgi:hypothetical protein
MLIRITEMRKEFFSPASRTGCGDDVTRLAEGIVRDSFCLLEYHRYRSGNCVDKISITRYGLAI